MDPQAMEALQQQQMAQMKAAAGIGIGLLIVELLIAAFFIACAWKIFVKASQPGWAALIPVYNIIVMLKIVGRPLWWIVLMLIPIVNFVIGIILCFDLAKAFGKSGGFGVGLLLLGFIFLPILAFGSATYKGPAKAAAPAAAAA